MKKKVMISMVVVVGILFSIAPITNMVKSKETGYVAFRTFPGGVTITLDGIGSKTSDEGDFGLVIWDDLDPGYYEWTASKLGYVTQSGNFKLITVKEVTVIMEPELESDLDASLVMPPYVTEEEPYVQGSIFVYNVGDEGSQLDWAITDHPTFGSDWAFTPSSSGNDLTPEQGAFAVTVTYVIPPSWGEYGGFFRLENVEDVDDVEYLYYTLIVSSAIPYSYDQCSCLMEIFPEMVVINPLTGESHTVDAKWGFFVDLDFDGIWNIVHLQDGSELPVTYNEESEEYIIESNDSPSQETECSQDEIISYSLYC